MRRSSRLILFILFVNTTSFQIQAYLEEIAGKADSAVDSQNKPSYLVPDNVNKLSDQYYKDIAEILSPKLSEYSAPPANFPIKPKAKSYSPQEYTPELMEALLSDCPQEITEIITLLQNESLDSTMRPNKMLLVGPPGTGKTTVGNIIAMKCSMPCYMYKASLIANEWVNSGNLNLEALFADAEAQKPCVIIIDELQSLVNQSKNRNTDNQQMIVTLWSLLDYYENKGIFFIGILNQTKNIPEQIVDRFRDDIVYLPLPNQKLREKILKFYMEAVDEDVAFDNSVDVPQLALLTEGFSQRNLVALINKVKKIARCRYLLKLREQGLCMKMRAMVTMDDCIKAIEYIKEAPKKLRKIRSWRMLGKKVGYFALPYVFTLAVNITLFYLNYIWLKPRNSHPTPNYLI